MPQLSEFVPIGGMDGFFVASNGKLQCVAVQLRSGGLCLYSPVADLGDKARQSLRDLGAIEVLLAPNHYHNKALAAYKSTYPNAKLVTSKGARPRLEKVTGLAFEGPEELSSQLPDDVRFVTPAGLKTGEVWLVTSIGLVVVDAFVGQGSAGLLKTFPTYGVKDAKQYLGWVKGFLSKAAPVILVPCHGTTVRDDDLAAKLGVLVDGAFS